jgi:hypothetical protein
MGAADKLLERITSAGSAGVKKSDLRREFGEEIDPVLEECITKGLVYSDKRGGAYYCWHKSFYVQSLLNSDPRFRLTYDMIKSLEESVNSTSRDASENLKQLARNMSNLAALVTAKSEFRQQIVQTGNAKAAVSTSQFKEEFDTVLANSAGSIGWVELRKIRNELCDRLGLSSDEFYDMVSGLASQYQDKYELSTGGGEGVMIRGLLHGFVRCI